MDLTDTATTWAGTRPRRRARTSWLAQAAMPRRSTAITITLAVAAGLAIVAAGTSVIGRGDYGQWLMTSRYYLGESVPGYRVVSDLPPLVPLLLAGLRLVIGDQVMALQVLNVSLLLALTLSFHFVGATLLRSPLGGVLTAAAALLVSDRFLELSAFGGLFQLAGIVFVNVAVVALVRAGDGRRRSGRWWALGGLSLLLLVLAHVGTATVGVPIAMAVATVSAMRGRRHGVGRLLRESAPFLVATAAVAAYGIAVLLPAGHDYLTNPASLAYRGPDRLLSSLVAYRPGSVVLGLGTLGVLGAALGELRRRRLGHGSALLTWALVAWGAVAYSALSGAATDYPRFSTVVLGPLAVGTAGFFLVAGRRVGRWIGRLPPVRRLHLPRAAGATLLASAVILAAAPFAAIRYGSLMATYQPLDATGLTAAVALVNASLGNTPGSVLTVVRDGKWLEGVTGREALFSQPVRYAFRPDEWQRSVDADTLLLTSEALTNQFFFVKYGDRLGQGKSSAVRSMTIAMNHGGEFVDVLQLRASATQLVGADAQFAIAESGPRGMATALSSGSASLTTRWRQARGSATAAFKRTVKLLDNGSTMSITDSAPGYRLQTTLAPPLGMAIGSMSIQGREALICLTAIGGSEPCLRVYASQPDAVLSAAPGGLSVRTTTSTRLSLFVTDLTPGGASVGLGILDPARIVREHDVRAALLVRTDPAFAARSRRLASLGFHSVGQPGIYDVMVRGTAAAQPGPGQ